MLYRFLGQTYDLAILRAVADMFFLTFLVDIEFHGGKPRGLVSTHTNIICDRWYRFSLAGSQFIYI